MGKRILIFILLAIVVVVGVAVGATMLFKVGYEDLTALQAQEAARAELGLDEELPEPINTFVSVSQTEEDVDRVEAPEIVVEESEDVNLTRASEKVSEMTLEEKLCQMMFVTPEALTGYTTVTQSGSVTQVSFNKYPVGGVIYFDKNLITADQTKRMLTNLQDFARERSGFGVFIGVDEEGGSVARLADNLGTTAFEDMSVYGATGDTQQAYDIGYTISEDMRSLGFNVDFAPVADLADALVAFGRAHDRVPMVGRTHLQPAMPSSALAAMALSTRNILSRMCSAMLRYSSRMVTSTRPSP